MFKLAVTFNFKTEKVLLVLQNKLISFFVMSHCSKESAINSFYEKIDWAKFNHSFCKL